MLREDAKSAAQFTASKNSRQVVRAHDDRLLDRLAVCRTTTTGPPACRATCWATEPTPIPSKTPRPRLPTTTRDSGFRSGRSGPAPRSRPRSPPHVDPTLVEQTSRVICPLLSQARSRWSAHLESWCRSPGRYRPGVGDAPPRRDRRPTPTRALRPRFRRTRRSPRSHYPCRHSSRCVLRVWHGPTAPPDGPLVPTARHALSVDHGSAPRPRVTPTTDPRRRRRRRRPRAGPRPPPRDDMGPEDAPVPGQTLHQDQQRQQQDRVEHLRGDQERYQRDARARSRHRRARAVTSDVADVEESAPGANEQSRAASEPVKSQIEYAVERGRMAAARRAAPMRPTANSVPARPPASGARARAASWRLSIGNVLVVQGGRTGHNHEEPDDAGEQGAEDDVDPLVAQIGDGELLVDGVGLDEAEPPRGQRRAHGGGDDRTCRRGRRTCVASPEPGHRCRPVGMGQHPGADVGHEHGGQPHEHVLDTVEAACAAPARHTTTALTGTAR